MLSFLKRRNIGLDEKLFLIYMVRLNKKGGKLPEWLYAAAHYQDTVYKSNGVLHYD